MILAGVLVFRGCVSTSRILVQIVLNSVQLNTSAAFFVSSTKSDGPEIWQEPVYKNSIIVVVGVVVWFSFVLLF